MIPMAFRNNKSIQLVCLPVFDLSLPVEDASVDISSTRVKGFSTHFVVAERDLGRKDKLLGAFQQNSREGSEILNQM